MSAQVAGRSGAPSTKIARQGRIRQLLGTRAVRSQGELVDLLAAEGLQVTQGTLSRDLVDVGATRVRAVDGTHVYALMEENDDVRARDAGTPVFDARLPKLCAELLVAAEASANLVVLHTPPGAASFLAQAIDHSVLPAVLGTIAGDDTVVVISRDPAGGEDVAAQFLALADGASAR